MNKSTLNEQVFYQTNPHQYDSTQSYKLGSVLLRQFD